MARDAINKLNPYFEKLERLYHLLSLLNFDVETTAPADAIDQENDLIAFYSAEAASISQDPEFIALVKAAKDEFKALKSDQFIHMDITPYDDLIPSEKDKDEIILSRIRDLL